MAKRVRADLELVEQGLAPSREKARALILAGEVLAGDRPIDKAGDLVDAGAELRLRSAPMPYVSRGGIKLAHALDTFGVDVRGAVALDVGASTGGFTDCLLQRGARRVAAVDVAYGQIDVRLREDPRVTVIERLNGRDLRPSDLPFAPALATVDVSFISLTKILPAVAGCLAPGGEALAMVKPQFELGRKRVGRGVVRDGGDRREAIHAVAAAAAGTGMPVRGVVSSGLPGPKGNRETFLWCGGDGPPLADLDAAIHAAVEVDK